MTASARSQQSRRLLQLGVALLLFSALDGFAIPFFASPRIGLSVHAERAASRHLPRVRTPVAEAQPRTPGAQGRVLVRGIFRAGDTRRIRHRGDLGCG